MNEQNKKRNEHITFWRSFVRNYNERKEFSKRPFPIFEELKKAELKEESRPNKKIKITDLTKVKEG